MSRVRVQDLWGTGDRLCAFSGEMPPETPRQSVGRQDAAKCPECGQVIFVALKWPLNNRERPAISMAPHNRPAPSAREEQEAGE